jgi:DNA-binding NtrC family response regulator
MYSVIAMSCEAIGSTLVKTFESGKTAIAWLSEFSVDVIVPGYDIPEMNGIALLQALRSKGDMPRLFFSPQ